MYKNSEGYPDPTQGQALNGVRKEEIQRLREKQHNLKRGEIIRIKVRDEDVAGRAVKTAKVKVIELYAHCVLLEDEKGFRSCPDYWKLNRLRV